MEKPVSQQEPPAARWYRLVLAFVFLPLLIVISCRNEPADPVTSRVLLIETQYLQPPAVDSARRVYQPTRVLELDDDLRLAAFRLYVDAGTSDLILEGGLKNIPDKRELARIDNPEEQEGDFALLIEQVSLEHEGLLKAGSGLFWVEIGQQTNHYLVTVVLPWEGVWPYRSLQIATLAIGDIPIAGLELELARDFFYMVVVGDSVQWGNGLKEDEKMSSLVVEAIESELDVAVVLQRYAHSGATIFPRGGDGICEFNCFGEVPEVNTSILAQVDQVVHPELVDFVLANGCINDVNVATIVNPVETPASIAELTNSLCAEGMMLLLKKIRATMPSAAIVVTGYYQFVSLQSDVVGLNAWLEAQNLPPSDFEATLVPIVTANSVSFHDTAHAVLQSVIAQVSSESADARIAFADPGFGEANAVFAPEAWLWGMTADAELLESLGINIALAPMDDIKELRVDRCVGSNLELDQLIICLYASVGHPTPTGAQAYAVAILQQLREQGILP